MWRVSGLVLVSGGEGGRKSGNEGTHELSGGQTIASSVLLELVNGGKRVEEGRSRHDGRKVGDERKWKESRKRRGRRFPSDFRLPKLRDLELSKHGCARSNRSETRGKKV